MVAVQELCGSFALPHKCVMMRQLPRIVHGSHIKTTARNLDLLLRIPFTLSCVQWFTACRTNETVQPVLPPLKKEVKKTIIGREALN
jgi:hypothetical protein